MYVIAVDDNGTREEQQSLGSIASFEFVTDTRHNYSSLLTEFIETSFQHYSYALPQLEEEAEGNYILTLGCYIIVVVTCNTGIINDIFVKYVNTYINKVFMVFKLKDLNVYEQMIMM